LRTLGQDIESEGNYQTAVDIYKANSQTQAGGLANALASYAFATEDKKLN